ncbi:fluoride efflux transporter CrcB [Propioniciclava sinopodophylli]|uniref:Fluoride-specific ion channel FluC n=1 Tax=Propioniciclava sinopodophylli TaxID=1837344 RepID=A0A4Q9KDV9_9ACTN|nr:fluoride efflux transporter CrcB [Propioniciclava sinopodophylli]TBT85066.1 fluoride efflux transporter CrcB [Propioniciclava sinopodophylli]
MTWLWVALAGGVGAVLRHLAHTGAQHAGWRSPWATLAVNVAGSFAIGIVAGFGARVWSPELVTVLATGLLGGFTTFSTASVEAADLWRDGRRGPAVGLATAMLVGSVAACALGWWLASLPL